MGEGRGKQNLGLFMVGLPIIFLLLLVSALLWFGSPPAGPTGTPAIPQVDEPIRRAVLSSYTTDSGLRVRFVAPEGPFYPGEAVRFHVFAHNPTAYPAQERICGTIAKREAGCHVLDLDPDEAVRVNFPTAPAGWPPDTILAPEPGLIRLTAGHLLYYAQVAEIPVLGTWINGSHVDMRLQLMSSSYRAGVMTGHMALELRWHDPTPPVEVLAEGIRVTAPVERITFNSTLGRPDAFWIHVRVADDGFYHPFKWHLDWESHCQTGLPRSQADHTCDVEPHSWQASPTTPP